MLREEINWRSGGITLTVHLKFQTKFQSKVDNGPSNVAKLKGSFPPIKTSATPNQTGVKRAVEAPSTGTLDSNVMF
jgi:hypothetical protein